MDNNNFICSGCNKYFKTNKSLKFHNDICFYYQYNIKYINSLDKITLNNIIKFSNIFKLHKLDINSIIYKYKILEQIKIQYYLQNKDNYYLYIYELFINNNCEEYSYLDLINIISNIFHISNNDILNIINSYKKCYNYLSV
jgi:hypothetical protein